MHPGDVTMQDIMKWLLDSDEPWTRYRTLLDLEVLPPNDPVVQQARQAMLSHPQIQALIATAATLGDTPLKRHNDAAHPLYSLATLADFGLRYPDPGITSILDNVMDRQSAEGAFQTLCNISPKFGGTGVNQWAWFNCDAPTVLYILQAMGATSDPSRHDALQHLLAGAAENGWHCASAPELGGFRGPGRRDDPCPIANVYALKALVQFPELHDSAPVRAGADMLLWHWEHQKERKLYLFGIGTDFRKLKYPFVWYDILHVVEVLSHLDYVRQDSRFKDMVTEITIQADNKGRFTASSMYRAWKGWSFADKKTPSPWLTFLVLRMLKRLA